MPSTLAPLVTTTIASGSAPATAPEGATSVVPTVAPAVSVSVAPGPTTSSTTSTTSTTTSTTVLATTTTTIVTEGATVRVANATDVPGAAGRLSEQLRDRGFTVADPTNSAGNEEFLDVSKVYFLPSGEPVARSIALLMGLAATPMPVPAPIVDATAGLREATVLVMLGSDLAGKPFPGA